MGDVLLNYGHKPNRFGFCLVGALALLVSSFPVATAETEASTVELASPPELDEGLLFFNDGDFAEAIAALAEVQGDQQNPYWLEARSVMGRSFDALGMGQLALDHYADVLAAGPEHEAFEQAFNASAALSRFIEDDATFSRAVLGLSAEQLPTLERSYGLYVAGNRLFDADLYDQSINFLAAIPRGDELFARARLQMAKALIMVEQRPMALAVLQDILDNDTSSLAAIPDGRSLVHLNIARMAYGMALFDQAADHYARVSRTSPYWGDALMERAWAQYALWQGQDLDQALSSSLGALLTLTSPTMENLYYPEAWLLEAQIFFILCKANSGNMLIERFLARHKSLHSDLVAALPAAATNPIGVYQTVVDHRLGKTPKTQLPAPFLNLFLTDPSFDRIEAHLERIEREIDLVKRQRRAWAGGLDGAFIASLQSHAESVRQQRGEEIAYRLGREAEILQQTILATELAQLDMLTQQVNLFEAAAAGRVTPPKQKKRRWTLPDDRRVWPFEGEYWVDELGYYQVTTLSECGTIQE